jgi:hypothetical protein
VSFGGRVIRDAAWFAMSVLVRGEVFEGDRRGSGATRALVPIWVLVVVGQASGGTPTMRSGDVRTDDELGSERLRWFTIYRRYSAGKADVGAQSLGTSVRGHVWIMIRCQKVASGARGSHRPRQMILRSVLPLSLAGARTPDDLAAATGVPPRR